MIVRSLIVAGLFGALGVGILMRPAVKPKAVSEAWLEQQYPSSLGKYSMRPSEDGSAGHSYKMDATTYDTLKPYGIVGRVLTDGPHSYDVVQIAGDSEESFHNPLLCFQAQGWKTKDIREIVIPTKSRGDVHATIAEASLDGAPSQFALYTYEGPTRMSPSPFALKDDMVKQEFRTGRAQFGTFFRFMSLTQNIGESDIVKFAHDYLESCPVRPLEKL